MKKGFISDFKAFITKGNILDMAVGVIMGGAFGKIVSSLVADIIMPAIGALCNTKSLADMKYVITEAVPASEDGTVAAVAEVAIKYGQFIMYIIDFLIVALCMFIVIKMFVGMRTKLENLKKAEEVVEEAEAPAEPTVEEKTLATLNDIKELLEKNSK
ncbi:MAG: large conductance mechanosensitive channel protein MscL [Ruminococcaceae bacterium]|nr:large conductance mechanosensitive channel protein MscL [Oscillospiraceae bacterium]